MSGTQDRKTDGDRDDDASATDPNPHKRRRKKRSKRHKYTVEEKEEKIEEGNFYTNNNNNVPEAVLKLDNEVTKRNKRNIFTTWFTLYPTMLYFLMLTEKNEWSRTFCT